MTNPNPITSLLFVLDEQLFEASHRAKSAYEAALNGDLNLAIGTLLPAERHCNEAAALTRVILSLHQHQRDRRVGGSR